MTHSRFPKSVLLALVLLSACQAEPLQTDAPLTGSWGGPSIALQFEGSDGKLEYDCASGSIDGPVRPDHDGKFKAHGTHVPQHGGPTVEGQDPNVLPADYWGQVRGDQLTLSVRVPSLQLTLGPFSLRRRASARLMRCL